MSYENIKFNKEHMARFNGYFYMIDEDLDVLIQKTDDGITAFQFPLEIQESLLINRDYIDPIKCLHYDGYSFWSLQDFNETYYDGIVIRKWQISGIICLLVDQFKLLETSNQKYSVDAIAIENYITTLSDDTPIDTDVLYIDEYYDIVVVSGTLLGLGPNSFGEREVVTVNDVIDNRIYLDSGVTYNYGAEDSVSITPAFYIFNDYFNAVADSGSLTRHDADTGLYISSHNDDEYRNVKAAKFTRLKNILLDYDDVSTLLYVKNNSCKLRNMNDLLGESTEYKGNDDFDGTVIDEELWEITSGNPSIVDNKLFMSTAGSGHDRISSNYRLLNDFDVQVSGTIGGYTSLGVEAIYHYLKIESENLSPDKNLIISRTVYSGIDYISCLEDTGSGYNTLAEIPLTIVSGVDDYNFRIVRNIDNVSLLYEHTTFSGWQTLYNSTLFKTEAIISLGLDSYLATVSGTYFDNFEYNLGRLAFPVPSVPYYGVMNLDNIKSDKATFIPIYDIDVEGSTLYRLQNEATYFGGDYSWGTYNYQVSTIRPFIDFITVDSESHIIPATGRNTVTIYSITLDQYGQGVLDKPITFTDDDPTGFITRPIVNTNRTDGSGEANTVYMSGIDLREVNIVAEATQND